MEAEWLNLIGNLGFPIFTAVYFMTKMERQLKRTNELLTILVNREEKITQKGA